MLILKADIEKGGRAVLSTKDNYGEPIKLDALDYAETKNRFGWSVTVGVESSFLVVAKHFSDEYVLSTENGSVRMDGNYVRYIRPLQVWYCFYAYIYKCFFAAFSYNHLPDSTFIPYL